MNINIRLSTPDDKSLPWLDHTRCTALLTCPRWGMVRYMSNLTFPVSQRAMALEAGEAMHQCFAYIRLWHLYRAEPELALKECERLYGKAQKDKEEDVIQWVEDDKGQQVARSAYLASFLTHDEVSKGALETLYTSGYYDDPEDKRRTLTNLETALLLYCQRYEPLGSFLLLSNGQAAIENKIEFVVEFLDLGVSYRYVGRCDAVYSAPSGPIVVDNKTSSNIQNKWGTQWHTSHQLTGYMLWASLALDRQVTQAAVIALQLPLPRDEYKGYLIEQTTRNNKQISEFFHWLLTAVQIVENFSQNPFDAPLYTHSCFRYFRPCAFADWCRQDDEGFEVGKEALTEVPWDPHAGDD